MGRNICTNGTTRHTRGCQHRGTRRQATAKLLCSIPTRRNAGLSRRAPGYPGLRR